jgi:hypothetical protein
MIIEFEINGARVIVSGENVSVRVSEFHQSPRKAAEAVSERTAKQTEQEFRAKAEEAVEAKGAAVVDAASRVSDVRERQHASKVEFADDCKPGGNEQAAAVPVPAPTPLRAPKPLRPHCKRPGQEDCGGYGSKHCHSCEIAEVAA